MDLYEELVESYLTIFEHLAVIPQFPVLFNDKDEPCFHESPEKLGWSAFPDFLAVDLRSHQAQIIEVNKSGYADKISDLMKRTLANREKVESYVKWFVPDAFPIQWRFFVREKMVDRVKREIEAGGVQPSITTLEAVFDKLKQTMP
ncbi:MAG: hypothetical protein WB763_23600 [Terriglobia bacterium]|jgi:hypothetical protein